MNSFSLKEELKEESLKLCDAIQLKKSPIFADELVSSLGIKNESPSMNIDLVPIMQFHKPFNLPVLLSPIKSY